MAYCRVSEQNALSTEYLWEYVFNLNHREVLGLLRLKEVISVNNHLQDEVEVLGRIELLSESHLYY